MNRIVPTRTTSSAPIVMALLFLPALTLIAGYASGQTNDPVEALKNLSLEELMNLEVISVSREPEPYTQAPAAIQVITREDIRRSGATSIPEALRLATNLTVLRKNAHTWAISSRGFNTDLANKLLVLIDGRTVYTPLFSGVFWDRQNFLLEDIERIEVISGPGGSLWGANAVNGVINIITSNARDTQGLFLEAGGGSQLEAFSNIRYGGALGADTFFRVYGMHFDRDNEILPSGMEASDSWRMNQAGFRIDRDSATASRFTVQGDFYDGGENLSTGGLSQIQGGNLLGRWSRSFSADSDLALQAYYDRTHLTMPVPAQTINGVPLAPAGIFKEDLDTFDVDVQHRFRFLDRHGIVWGGGLRFTHDSVTNAPALAFEPPVRKQTLLQAFVHDEIRVTSNFAVTGGTKFERTAYGTFEVEPTVRLHWNVNTEQFFWAAASRAIRAPSRVDRDQRLPTPNLSPFINDLLVGNPEFESETLVALESGYRMQLWPDITASIATFYNVYDDVRSTSLGAPDPVFGLPFPLFFKNDLQGRTYGVEFNAGYYPLEWWRLQGAYNYLHNNIFVRPGGTDFNNALNETADPKHQVHLRSSMNLPGNLELDAAWRWIGRFRFNNNAAPGILPSYLEMDTRLGWHPTGWLELSVMGQDLLHRQHLEYAMPVPRPTTEIRRAVYGRMAIRW